MSSGGSPTGCITLSRYLVMSVPSSGRFHPLHERGGGKSTVSATASAVDAALELVAIRPAAVAALGRVRAVRAADRRVPLVVQAVVGHVVRGDVVPHVALAPVGER